MCADDCGICRHAGRVALDLARPETPVPGLSPASAPSGARGAAVQEFSRMEWHRADLRGGSWVSARTGAADKLVQHPALALPRRIVEIDLQAARDCPHYLNFCAVRRAPLLSNRYTGRSGGNAP